jgi:hypothetical protein
MSRFERAWKRIQNRRLAVARRLQCHSSILELGLSNCQGKVPVLGIEMANVEVAVVGYMLI